MAGRIRYRRNEIIPLRQPEPSLHHMREGDPQIPVAGSGGRLEVLMCAFPICRMASKVAEPEAKVLFAVATKRWRDAARRIERLEDELARLAKSD